MLAASVLSLVIFFSISNSFEIPKALTNEPYLDIQIDRIVEIYSDKSFTDFSGVKVRKVNKTRSIVGEQKIFAPFGNNVIVNIKMMKKQGGEYRLMPYRIPPTPYCDFCANDEYFYKDYAKDSDFPEDIKNNCPLQPGTYKFYGVKFSFKNVPKVIIPSGDYIADMNYKVENMTVLHFQVYASIVQI